MAATRAREASTSGDPTPAPHAPRAARDAVRRRASRLEAWAYTGPLGHLYSVVADVLVAMARYAARWLRTWVRTRLRRAS